MSQMVWTEETEGALEEFENGAEDAIKKYNEVCPRLEALIRLVQGDLSGNDRNKVITLITIDVHNRDMVGMLVEKKVESAQDFAWQSQLKFYWDPDKKDVGINICGFSSVYSFEYVGNCGRLVITPLTDRCYVTLTTALRLFLGGAPAGRGRARPRRPRTWRAVWACRATCSTAATSSTTRPWPTSSKGSTRLAPGAASTSSTASPSRC